MLSLVEIVKEVIENGEWTILNNDHSRVSYGNLTVRYISGVKRLDIGKNDTENLPIYDDDLIKYYCCYKNKAVEQKNDSLVSEFNEELEKAKRNQF